MNPIPRPHQGPTHAVLCGRVHIYIQKNGENKLHVTLTQKPILPIRSPRRRPGPRLRKRQATRSCTEKGGQARANAGGAGCFFFAADVQRVDTGSGHGLSSRTLQLPRGVHKEAVTYTSLPTYIPELSRGPGLASLCTRL